MNYKQDRINLFLYELQLISKIEKLDQKQVYLQLISYGIKAEDKLKDLKGILSISIDKYKSDSKVEFYTSNIAYFIKSKKNSKSSKEKRNTYPIKIHIPLKKDNIEKTSNTIIDFLIKNKIEHISKLSNKVRIDNLVVEVYNKKNADKIIDFINKNKELTDNIYETNPFFITDGKIFLTMDKTLSYCDILSKYIYRYIEVCNSNSMQANLEDFTNFIYKSLLEFKIESDLSKQVKMLDNYESLQEKMNILEQTTWLIYLNLQNQEKDNTISLFYDQYEKINNNNSSKYDYLTKENFEKDKSLLREIVVTMTKKYGYEYTKKAIYNYKESGKIHYNTKSGEIVSLHKPSDDVDYITRDNNLRQRVKNSKSFKTFINTYSDEELEQLLERFKPTMSEIEQEKIKTPKEMILEQICKETYLACQTEERNFTGKTQVAVSLIRMKSNDYSCITRKNDARIVAEKNIKPEEVLDIIKNSLEINGYIIENEADLYELYANHIEYLCNNSKKGRRQC